jgi:hypothetical protein
MVDEGNIYPQPRVAGFCCGKEWVAKGRIDVS